MLQFRSPRYTLATASLLLTTLGLVACSGQKTDPSDRLEQTDLAVVNGQEVSTRHPLAKHVVEVQIVKDRATGNVNACTGVLVRSAAGNPSDEKTVAVLTAAHCFMGVNADLTGSTFIRFGTVPNRSSIDRPARAILFPPGLRKLSSAQGPAPDLALVQFQGLPPTGFEPIELAERPPRPGTQLTSLGYGLTGFNKKDSGVLREGSLLFAFYDKLLEELHSESGEGPTGPQTNCAGDSGGPLIAKTNSGSVLVGILSAGGCESETTAADAVHMNVAAFRNWIETGLCDSNCITSNRVMAQASSIFEMCRERQETSCHRLAMQGHAAAQFQLGYLISLRSEDPAQQAEAVEWYRRAAEQGLPRAQLNLGDSYLFGNGIAKNAEQALFWFRKAAALGSSQAQYYLGKMFEHGEGVAPDDSRAAYWFKKAAAAGDQESQFSLGLFYYLGRGVAQSYSESVYWIQKAVATGHAEAQKQLGIAYLLGHGVPKDPQLAVSWILKAAVQGSIPAQYLIAKLYWVGDDVRQDLAQAELWMDKAAAAGFPKAREELPQLRQEIERLRARSNQQAPARSQAIGAGAGAVLQRLNKP